MIFKADIPIEFLRYDTARFVVVPAPYEKTVSYGRGTKNGPKAICEASQIVEYYAEELGREFYKIGIHTVPPVPSDLKKIQKAVERILADKKIPITLGGEHTISAAPIRACKKHYPNLSVVHFDAHADLRDNYEGTPLSHACVMRRVHDEGIPFVQIGIRSHSIEEKELIEKKGLHKPFYAYQIQSSDYWMDEALKLLSDDVYLTFDVDAFDPSIMPSTGTPEPGGMTWYQVVNFFKKLAETKNIVGADFVELAPVKGHPSSDYTVAKLIYKLMCFMSA